MLPVRLAILLFSETQSIMIIAGFLALTRAGTLSIAWQTIGFKPGRQILKTSVISSISL
jgi:hypothetical protein